MNQQLVQNEGTATQAYPKLAERMADWLRGEYRAVLFEEHDTPVGYALFRREPEFVYLRQLFVMPEQRRRGVARDALRLRIDVLVVNVSGRAFWRSIGFTEYSITMEAASPNPKY